MPVVRPRPFAGPGGGAVPGRQRARAAAEQRGHGAARHPDSQEPQVRQVA